MSKATPKYRNKPVYVDGSRFDSKKEAKRWGELQLLEKAGKIVGLRRQVPFDLIVKGFPVCKFVADFTYHERDDRLVVEDVKSPPTRKNPVYVLKRKLMYACHEIMIREV